MRQQTGTLPGIGPFSRPKQQPRRATLRHFPQVSHNGRCVRLVPCDYADRLLGGRRHALAV